MVYEYMLELKEGLLPEGTTLLQYGSLFTQEMTEIYASGLEYTHNKCIGSFIRDNDGKHVKFLTVKNFGDEAFCIFIPRSASNIFYMSGYDTRLVIDEIVLFEKDLGLVGAVAKKI